MPPVPQLRSTELLREREREREEEEIYLGIGKNYREKSPLAAAGKSSILIMGRVMNIYTLYLYTMVTRRIFYSTNRANRSSTHTIGISTRQNRPDKFVCLPSQLRTLDAATIVHRDHLVLARPS